MSRLSTLFSFCKKRGWIDENPCDRIERVRIDGKTPPILTPEQCDRLLRGAPTVCLPYFTLCLFCGIRPSECQRLTWSDINLEKKFVSVSAAASKVRQRRIVPIPDRAVKILEAFPIKIGLVAPSLSTIRRSRKRLLEITGGKWNSDLLRHTAISYALARHEDLGKVSTWMGNSPTIIKRHYDGMASKEDSDRFYAV